MSIKQLTVAVLVLVGLVVSSLPVLAQDGSVIITMNTDSVVAISLSQREWELGEVGTNTEKVTSPYATWCTITNQGNAKVHIYIRGEDAQWVGHPLNTYRWVLSDTNVSDPTNPDGHRYTLWYHIANDDAGSYTLITKSSLPMTHINTDGSNNGTPLSLTAYGSYAQFGLKLVTPTYFYGGRQMQTHITVSAVAA